MLTIQSRGCNGNQVCPQEMQWCSRKFLFGGAPRLTPTPSQENGPPPPMDYFLKFCRAKNGSEGVYVF